LGPITIICPSLSLSPSPSPPLPLDEPFLSLFLPPNTLLATETTTQPQPQHQPSATSPFLSSSSTHKQGRREREQKRGGKTEVRGRRSATLSLPNTTGGQRVHEIPRTRGADSSSSGSGGSRTRRREGRARSSTVCLGEHSLEKKLEPAAPLNSKQTRETNDHLKREREGPQHS
jgi:hypothetical protein